MMDGALLELGRELARIGYRFTTVSPATHARVIARRADARSLRDVFGWNLPFSPSLLPLRMLDMLRAADAIVGEGDRLRARVRFASLGDHLFAHSAYPTVDAESVFFGPDTYRFAHLLRREVPSCGRLVDVGCGSGAGALAVATRAKTLVLADINRSALSLARVNAALAGIEAEVLESDVLDGVEGAFDVVVANPPYMMDDGRRQYRDGGALHGAELSVRIAADALARLPVGGKLILYTGTAIVDGADTFRSAAMKVVAASRCEARYEELDPDVFGEELEREIYAGVERIAVVALIATRT